MVLAVSIHAGLLSVKLPIDEKRFLDVFGKPNAKFANGCSCFRYFGHRGGRELPLRNRLRVALKLSQGSMSGYRRNLERRATSFGEPSRRRLAQTVRTTPRWKSGSVARLAEPGRERNRPEWLPTFR